MLPQLTDHLLLLILPQTYIMVPEKRVTICDIIGEGWRVIHLLVSGCGGDALTYALLVNA